MVIVDKKKKIKNRTRQFGTSLCPRVVVSKSNTAIYCQLIDDSVENGGKVLAFCSSKQLDRSRKNCNISLSKTVGENMGKKIVAVNAGPRKGWNTDTLITEASKGAALVK